MAIIKVGDKATAPSIRPSLLLDFANSKALDPRITFTRASTATYWDGHTTAKAEENLQSRSTELNSTYWLPYNTTLTPNSTTAPDGTNTAAVFIESTSTTNHYLHAESGYVVTTATATAYTWSVYLKKGSGATAPDILCLGFRGATHTTAYANFNISTGAVTATSSATATISNAGNGWYRCTVSITANASGAGGGVLAFTNNNPTAGRFASYTGATTADVFVWGPQFEQRSSATAYTPTTSSPVVKYQPVLQTATPNGARFDHDPVTGESKGLLIEEARTNLMTYSNVLTGWYYSNVTRECETVIAPDGTATAVASRGDTIGSYQIYKPVSGISAGAVRTYSLYVKKYGSRYCYLANDPLNSAFVWFDLDNDAAVTEQGSNVISAGSEAVGNGWYRIWMVNSQHNNYTQYGFATQDSSSTAWGTANAPVTYSGIAWGYQFEVGAFPTSYIPTSGSTVTRSADAAELPSNTWYSDSGTLYADFNIAGPATGSYGNVVQLLENVGSRWGFPYINGNNTLTALAYNAPDITNPTLGGLSYGSNTRVVMTSPNGSQFVTSLNGASVVTTSATAVSNPISLSIGKVLSDNNTFTGTFSKIAYYPQRLPNATLQAMTEE